MVEKYPDALLRKVDIVGWESAAFKQASKKFGFRGIPYIRLYGKDGKDLGSPGRAIAGIESAVKKALQ